MRLIKKKMYCMQEKQDEIDIFFFNF